MTRAVLVLLAGCYAPRVEPGSPCDPGPCPSGLVCSPATHTCEATAVDVDAAIDTSAAPWLAGYTHRKQLTITTSSTETLADFAVSVVETADTDLAATARADGSDIVFTAADATTRIPAERVGYTAATGALEAWVRTSLPPGATTLYMYYGGAAVASSTDAWSTRFAGVWHMTGTAGSPDSTSHLHAASSQTLAAQPAAAGGFVGAARSYDGVDDSLAVPDPSDGTLDVGTRSFSYSVWVNVTASVGMFDIPFYKGGASIGDSGFDMELGTAQWNACLADTAVVDCQGFGQEAALLGRWVHLTAVVDRAAGKLTAYVDRAAVGSRNIAGVLALDNAKPLSLGHPTNLFHGTLDEVRVYTTALSPSWIAAEYDNLAARDSFVAIGSDEAMP